MAKLYQFRLKALLIIVTAIAILLGIGKIGYDVFLAPQPQRWTHYSRQRFESLQKSRQTAILYFYPGDDAGAYLDLVRMAEEPEIRHIVQNQLTDRHKAGGVEASRVLSLPSNIESRLPLINTLHWSHEFACRTLGGVVAKPSDAGKK